MTVDISVGTRGCAVSPSPSCDAGLGLELSPPEVGEEGSRAEGEGDSGGDAVIEL
jgi:hypothetical protein